MWHVKAEDWHKKAGRFTYSTLFRRHPPSTGRRPSRKRPCRQRGHAKPMRPFQSRRPCPWRRLLLLLLPLPRPSLILLPRCAPPAPRLRSPPFQGHGLPCILSLEPALWLRQGSRASHRPLMLPDRTNSPVRRIGPLRARQPSWRAVRKVCSCSGSGPGSGPRHVEPRLLEPRWPTKAEDWQDKAGRFTQSVLFPLLLGGRFAGPRECQFENRTRRS
jgi:hypothetical protein